MESVSNRITASKLVRRALQVADISNTDFLNYEEKIEYLNTSWKNVLQNIINYNLNVFTVKASLVGGGGVYPLPWDCYQIKSVKNPISGVEIPRKADSESAFGSYYEIDNDTIILGPSVGPIEIVYWRKPYFLTLPNETIDTGIDTNKHILDVCKNSVLMYSDDPEKEDYLYIYNLLTQSELEVPLNSYDYTDAKLGNNFIILIGDSTTCRVIGLDGSILLDNITRPDGYVKSDDGLYYFANDDIENHKVIVTEIDGNDVAEIPYNEDEPEFGIIHIEDEFYKVPVGAFPVGIFDDRPAYTYNKSLYLINDDGSTIEEPVHIPSIGPVNMTSYGFLTFDGKLYSNIPDTELNFPSNLYYDVISYDLAVRFLCKQNADSSGVENLNRNAWNQLTNSIDQSSDFQRVKLVRR